MCAVAFARRSLARALERFDDSLGKSRKQHEVADDFSVEFLVSCSRACGAASRGFVQRGAGPLFRPEGTAGWQRGGVVTSLKVVKGSRAGRGPAQSFTF